MGQPDAGRTVGHAGSVRRTIHPGAGKRLSAFSHKKSQELLLQRRKKMAVYKETIKVKSHGGTPSYINITGDVRRVIEESGIKSGISCRFGPLLPR